MSTVGRSRTNAARSKRTGATIKAGIGAKATCEGFGVDGEVSLLHLFTAGAGVDHTYADKGKAATTTLSWSEGVGVTAGYGGGGAKEGDYVTIQGGQIVLGFDEDAYRALM